MERRKKRKYSPEFKAGAVKLVLEEGRSMNSVAKELDVPSSVVTQWVHQAEADAGKGRKKNRLTTSEKQELTELRKKVRQLEMEKEILKKATAFFAKESK
jgi:transposase